MKKLFIAIVALTAASTASFAQRGLNQISIGPEVNIPTGDFGEGVKTGFGGSIKALFGIGTAGQITLTTGYTTFKFKDLEDLGDIKANYYIVPFLAGYRQNFSGFYVEPQVGYGLYGAKFKGGGESETSSDGAFTYAVGLGYAMGPVDLGVRYQAGTQDGETLSLVGVRVAYVFNLGGRAVNKK
jgi:hypothetical protein